MSAQVFIYRQKPFDIIHLLCALCMFSLFSSTLCACEREESKNAFCATVGCAIAQICHIFVLRLWWAQQHSQMAKIATTTNKSHPTHYIYIFSIVYLYTFLVCVIPKANCKLPLYGGECCRYTRVQAASRLHAHTACVPFSAFDSICVLCVFLFGACMPSVYHSHFYTNMCDAKHSFAQHLFFNIFFVCLFLCCVHITITFSLTQPTHTSYATSMILLFFFIGGEKK